MTLPLARLRWCTNSGSGALGDRRTAGQRVTEGSPGIGGLLPGRVTALPARPWGLGSRGKRRLTGGGPAAGCPDGTRPQRTAWHTITDALGMKGLMAAAELRIVQRRRTLPLGSRAKPGPEGHKRGTASLEPRHGMHSRCGAIGEPREKAGVNWREQGKIWAQSVLLAAVETLGSPSPSLSGCVHCAPAR